MLKLTKTDNFTMFSEKDGEGLLEITLTTTYKKESDKGIVEETHSIKTYDVDIDRAYDVLSRAMSSYFLSIRNIFNGDENVDDKSNQISTA
jgi:hypothetical protein